MSPGSTRLELLLAEGQHWINLRRTSRWEPTRDRRNQADDSNLDPNLAEIPVVKAWQNSANRSHKNQR